MELIEKYIVPPNNYINGWKQIKTNLTTLPEKELPEKFGWLYVIGKTNEETIYKIIGITTLHDLNYFKIISNNYKNFIGIGEGKTVLSTPSFLFYKDSSIEFNCSKETRTINVPIIHHANCPDELFESFFARVTNAFIVKGINTYILQLPRPITGIEPFITVTQYKLKIPKRDIENNPHKIFDYDGIPKFDETKIEKIKKRLHEIYEIERKKYKLSQPLSFTEFCEKYINNHHKIYLTINAGIITDFMMCINSSTMKLDFYTLNAITINNWINYVSNDDEIIINNIMRNHELLIQENKIEKVGEQYLYFFNVLVKKMNPTNYALTVY